MTVWLLAAALVLTPPADPPKVGMSAGVFRLAVVGQLADLVTTEFALAHGGQEANPLMRHRAVRVPLKVGLPLFARWISRNTPRAQANATGILIGVDGLVPAAWNVYVVVRH